MASMTSAARTFGSDHLVSSQYRAAPTSEQDDAPLIAVVDPTGRLACWVQTLSDLLGIRLALAPDAAALSAALEGQAPMAVLCGDLDPGEHTGRPVADLIKLVACYDPTMPLLLLTADDPETLGAIDAAAKLWPLLNMQRAAGDIHPETVLAFLARIGRRTGSPRLMAA